MKKIESFSKPQYEKLLKIINPRKTDTSLKSLIMRPDIEVIVRAAIEKGGKVEKIVGGHLDGLKMTTNNHGEPIYITGVQRGEENYNLNVPLNFDNNHFYKLYTSNSLNDKNKLNKFLGVMTNSTKIVYDAKPNEEFKSKLMVDVDLNEFPSASLKINHKSIINPKKIEEETNENNFFKKIINTYKNNININNNSNKKNKNLKDLKKINSVSSKPFKLSKTSNNIALRDSNSNLSILNNLNININPDLKVNENNVTSNFDFNDINNLKHPTINTVSNKQSLKKLSSSTMIPESIMPYYIIPPKQEKKPLPTISDAQHNYKAFSKEDLCGSLFPYFDPTPGVKIIEDDRVKIKQSRSINQFGFLSIKDYESIKQKKGVAALAELDQLFDKKDELAITEDDNEIDFKEKYDGKNEIQNYKKSKIQNESKNKMTKVNSLRNKYGSLGKLFSSNSLLLHRYNILNRIN